MKIYLAVTGNSKRDVVKALREVSEDKNLFFDDSFEMLADGQCVDKIVSHGKQTAYLTDLTEE